MNDFIKLVSKMRALQKEYFKTRNKDILMQSKAAEQEVDKYIYNHNNPSMF